VGYVDSTYYTTTYKGTQIPSDEVEFYLVKASDSIDQLTSLRIAARGFETLSAFQQRYIKMATCVQAEHLYNNEDILSNNLGGYSVGDVSVSLKEGIDLRYSRQALEYLLPTGFMYRGL